MLFFFGLAATSSGLDTETQRLAEFFAGFLGFGLRLRGVERFLDVSLERPAVRVEMQNSFDNDFFSHIKSPQVVFRADQSEFDAGGIGRDVDAQQFHDQSFSTAVRARLRRRGVGVHLVAGCIETLVV
jgi:hypothetical protein